MDNYKSEKIDQLIKGTTEKKISGYEDSYQTRRVRSNILYVRKIQFDFNKQPYVIVLVNFKLLEIKLNSRSFRDAIETH